MDGTLGEAFVRESNIYALTWDEFIPRDGNWSPAITGYVRIRDGNLKRAIRVIAKDFGTIVKGSVKIEDGRVRFNAGTPGRHYRIWLQPIRVRDI